MRIKWLLRWNGKVVTGRWGGELKTLIPTPLYNTHIYTQRVTVRALNDIKKRKARSRREKSKSYKPHAYLLCVNGSRSQRIRVWRWRFTFASFAVTFFVPFFFHLSAVYLPFGESCERKNHWAKIRLTVGKESFALTWVWCRGLHVTTTPPRPMISELARTRRAMMPMV